MIPSDLEIDGERSIYAGYTIECTTNQKWRGVHPSKIGAEKLSLNIMLGALLVANTLF